jgi:DNA-binding PadR family transcriptional regulator
MRKSSPGTKLTMADMVVLSLIAEGPQHGYAVGAELARRQVEDWASVSRAQIYYSLEKLAKIGHIRATRDAKAATGPERAVYAITAAGTRALRAALADTGWATQRPPPPFLTWVLLAWYGDPADRARVIAERVRFLDTHIVRERDTIAAIARDDPQASTAILVVELLLAQFEVERAWLDRLAADPWMTGERELRTETQRRG